MTTTHMNFILWCRLLQFQQYEAWFGLVWLGLVTFAEMLKGDGKYWTPTHSVLFPFVCFISLIFVKFCNELLGKGMAIWPWPPSWMWFLLQKFSFAQFLVTVKFLISQNESCKNCEIFPLYVEKNRSYVLYKQKLFLECRFRSTICNFFAHKHVI